MRICMRPVNLGRIVDIARISQNEQELTVEKCASVLSTSLNHTAEILDEMCDLKMLNKTSESYRSTDHLGEFREAIIHEDWKGVHMLFMNHVHYKRYYEEVCNQKRATLEQLSDQLVLSENPHFNKTSIDIVADWAERIGAVQRNIVTGEIYPILHQSFDFKTELIQEYSAQNVTYNNLKQTYVEIPKLRERICQNCFMSRSEFDQQLKTLILNNIGVLDLSGAPVNSHAKMTAKKIKHITMIPYSDRLSMKLTSDQYLSGIEINKRMYYYLAYHGENLK